jgi:hypothetical protein
MAEYVLREDEDLTATVQELLANADHPDDVRWQPRSGVPHGGVYEISEALSDKVIAHRRAVRDAEAKRIEDAQAAADERDADPAVAEGLATPEEAGFAANTPADLSQGDDDDADESDDDADQGDEAARDGDATPAADADATKDENPPTTRKHRRRATAKPADDAAATASTDSKAEEAK